MAQWLKQSTSVTVKVGPFLDEDDGKTVEGSLTITQPDVRLSKNGGAFAQKNAAQTLAHDENGYYGLTLNATDTGTLGRLTVHIHESGALPVWHDFEVVTANAWDSFFGADTLKADVTQIGGDTQSATDLKDFADAGYDPGTNKVQGVVLVDTCAALTGHTAQSGDSYARLGAPTGPSVSADVAAVGVNTAAILTDTNELQTDDVPGLIGALNDPDAADIADAVYDEARAGHKAAGSFGEAINRVHAADANRLVSNNYTGLTTVYEDDGVTVSHQRTVGDGATDDEVEVLPT